MGGFELSAGVDANKIFLVKRSELEGRLDIDYYRPAISALEKKVREQSTKKLKDFIAKIASGATPSVQEETKFYSDKGNGIPFLRVQNLNDSGELSLDDVKFINQETHDNYLKRSQVSEHDLLVKITGVGRMAIASVAPDGFVGNTNQHMVVIKTASAEQSRYLSNYLNLDITEALASRRATGATRPALDYPALKSIPVIEHLDFSVLKKAESLKQQKERQAQTLLDGIDAYLLTELGISLPEQDNRLEKRMFTVPLNEVTGGRLDPDYHKVYYHEIISQIKKSKFRLSTLGEATSLLASGKTPASFEYSETPTEHPIIKVGSYSQHFIDLDKTDFALQTQKLGAKKGDIFILSAAHQPEYVGRHIKYLNDEPKIKTAYVGELICVRTNEKCNSMFLFSLLMLDIFKILINREKTGQTSHVYGKDIKSIEIPLPPIEKQNEIAAHISNVRAQAKQLQQEAAQILAEAKAEIERMILGEIV